MKLYQKTDSIPVRRIMKGDLNSKCSLYFSNIILTVFNIFGTNSLLINVQLVMEVLEIHVIMLVYSNS